MIHRHAAPARLLGNVIFALWLALAGVVFSPAHARGFANTDVVHVRDLPPEAQRTIALIHQGGPFPYRRDGIPFGNFEGVLPKQKRGYYHEFTVKSPGSRNRGARRIVVGGPLSDPDVLYYTDNHYATFRRIIE